MMELLTKMKKNCSLLSNPLLVMFLAVGFVLVYVLWNVVFSE